MFAGANRPTMIILDDATSYSAPIRLAALKRALLDAATRHQIFVLRGKNFQLRRSSRSGLRPGDRTKWSSNYAFVEHLAFAFPEQFATTTLPISRSRPTCAQ
jgi:hypothetical protein